MTKKVKKRSEHYEDKLALDASFEDIIKLSVSDSNLNLMQPKEVVYSQRELTGKTNLVIQFSGTDLNKKLDFEKNPTTILLYYNNSEIPSCQIESIIHVRDYVNKSVLVIDLFEGLTSLKVVIKPNPSYDVKDLNLVLFPHQT